MSAIVTGGSRGIGRAIVEELAHSGHAVEFCYRSREADAAEVVDRLTADGCAVRATAVDVADHVAVNAWLAEVEKRSGPVGIAVNSAGITRDRAFLTMSQNDWSSVMGTNLNGVFNVCRAVSFGMMKRRAGSIVNLSSVSGLYGNVGQANYAASKSGIIGFSRTLAKELGRYGVRVNVVAPGLIETDMIAGLTKLDDFLRQIPLGSVGTPRDVALSVAFLVSPSARYITGQTLGVDGGLVF